MPGPRTPGVVPGRTAGVTGRAGAATGFCLGTWIEATRPKKVRTYEPDLEAKKTYDRVYEIYRRLYELLGRSEVRLLHDLKRIRTERRGA